MKLIKGFIWIFVCASFSTVSLSSQATNQTAQQLVEGLDSNRYIVLMRHALAPGTGDPTNFDLKDCSTQRNLSDGGREQAIRIGERLRSSGIDNAKVFTSQWCRCRETAKLLGFDEYTDLPIINSFFRNFEREQEQTDDLLTWLKKESRKISQPIILVTHQVNITALTDVFPKSGEMIFIELQNSETVNVVGRLMTDY